MTSLSELAQAKGPLASSLATGVNTLSQTETVVFTRYNRLVLPLDGYVFWVKADLLTSSALINSGPINVPYINQATSLITPSPTVSIQGSLHYSTDISQEVDSTVAYNNVVFTALEPVDAFQEINPNYIYIAEYDDIKFAFSSRGKLYAQADLYHYVGTALSATFLTQIIDDPSRLNPQEVIVSDSLPIWLAMPRYTPPYPGFTCQIPLYPSFLVPENEPPPYGVVHIDPDRTEGWATSPIYDSTYGRSQLARDSVTVTLYGCNNSAASNFLDFILQYSYDHNYIGMVNMPVIRDEKKPSPEFSVIAQKKSIQFEVNYLQSVARNIARALITSCIVPVTNNPFPVGLGDEYTITPAT